MKIYYFKKFCKTATELSDKRKIQLISVISKSLQDDKSKLEDAIINRYIIQEKDEEYLQRKSKSN